MNSMDKSKLRDAFADVKETVNALESLIIGPVRKTR